MLAYRLAAQRTTRRCFATTTTKKTSKTVRALQGAGAVGLAGAAYVYNNNEGLWRYMRVGAALVAHPCGAFPRRASRRQLKF